MHSQVSLTNLTSLACNDLAIAYFGEQEFGPKLWSVVTEAIAFHRSEVVGGKGARRRADLKQGAKLARDLVRLLTVLDQATLLDALRKAADARGGLPASSGPIEAHGPYMSRQRAFYGIEQLRGGLQLLGEGLELVVQAEPVRRGRKLIPDAITFGVECLAAIWRHATGKVPMEAYKQGGFGALACDLFLPSPAAFPELQVRSAVSQVVRKEQRRARIANGS